MFPHENPIKKPEIVATPPYQVLLESVKSDVIAYFTEHAPNEAMDIQATLANKAELITKFIEAMTTILQSHFRKMNAQALQMFGMYATEYEMVDLIVSQLNITRQVITPGDASAFPVVPPVLESNNDLLTRYYLAAYALASTGTRGGYRFHAMTLGGRPSLTVESPEASKVVVTYQFEYNDFSGQTKDAQARQISPGVVDCYILAHEGSGIPPQGLIEATQAYMSSDEIAQETDLLTVKPATVKGWSCTADLYIHSGLDRDLVIETATKALQDYADMNHRLGANIELSMIAHILLKTTNAHRSDLTQPAQRISCTYSEAPYLESITINTIIENS
jgi:phage-related baseplate assembly protein